jgi:hypothetical protein
MERLVDEQQTQAVLRDLERKRKAQAILAGRSKPNPFLLWLCIAGATLVAQFALQGLNAPVVADALMAVMFAGLVILSIEVWVVRRRLEAIIQLCNLRGHEQA